MNIGCVALGDVVREGSEGAVREDGLDVPVEPRCAMAADETKIAPAVTNVFNLKKLSLIAPSSNACMAGGDLSDGDQKEILRLLSCTA